MNGDILRIIRESALMGAAEVVRKLRPADDRISQSQAIKEYGRAFLDDNADRLSVFRVANRKEYSRAELEQVMASRNVALLAMRIECNLTTNQ